MKDGNITVSRRKFGKAIAGGAMSGWVASTTSPSAAASAVGPVRYFDSKEVAAATVASAAPDVRMVGGKPAHRHGGVLVDFKEGENKYLVRMASHDKPDWPMMHPFTHVFYVLGGAAIMITGGTIVDPKPIDSITPWGGEEIRGSAIAGGEARHLSKDDVIVVPKGTPHWWKQITGAPFSYFAVNLR
jgi:mannose-6-phosphate isomerase-like protein (cupin superfamily)